MEQTNHAKLDVDSKLNDKTGQDWPNGRKHIGQPDVQTLVPKQTIFRNNPILHSNTSNPT